MQNGFHPHPSPHPPPRNPSPNHDFMGVLYTVLVGKAKETCKTVLVNSVFFFLFVIRARTVQLFCQKQFKPFLVSPPPPPPALKKKKKERKKGKPRTGLSGLKSVFRFRVVRSEFQKFKSRFPNRIRRPFYLLKLVVSCHGNGCVWVFILWPIFHVWTRTDYNLAHP